MYFWFKGVLSHEFSTNKKEETILSLRQFILSCGVTSIQSSETYFSPNIPLNKLDGALVSYGYNAKVNAKDVIVLMDDTVFGSAKDGLIITDEYIVIKEGFTRSQTFVLNYMTDIKSQDGSIFIADRKVAKMTLVGKSELAYVFNVISRWMSLIRKPVIPIDGSVCADKKTLQSICSKYIEPKYKEESSRVPFNKPKVTPFFYVGSDIPQDKLRMARFSLSISDSEEIVALYDLSVGQDAQNAFIIAVTGIYSKGGSDKDTIYISWNRLKTSVFLKDSCNESIYYGVIFSNNTRILCTRDSGIVKPFGFEIMHDLIDSIDCKTENSQKKLSNTSIDRFSNFKNSSDMTRLKDAVRKKDVICDEFIKLHNLSLEALKREVQGDEIQAQQGDDVFLDLFCSVIDEQIKIMPNLRVKCDKHPANYCVIFDGSEVISVFNFVVGACALRE
jgi:hypothetical protein